MVVGYLSFNQRLSVLPTLRCLEQLKLIAFQTVKGIPRAKLKFRLSSKNTHFTSCYLRVLLPSPTSTQIKLSYHFSNSFLLFGCRCKWKKQRTRLSSFAKCGDDWAVKAILSKAELLVKRTYNSVVRSKSSLKIFIGFRNRGSTFSNEFTKSDKAFTTNLSLCVIHM